MSLSTRPGGKFSNQVRGCLFVGFNYNFSLFPHPLIGIRCNCICQKYVGKNLHDFGSSVNPIWTKGGRTYPPKNSGTPGFSDLPTALLCCKRNSDIHTYCSYTAILKYIHFYPITANWISCRINCWIFSWYLNKITTCKEKFFLLIRTNKHERDFVH